MNTSRDVLHNSHLPEPHKRVSGVEVRRRIAELAAEFDMLVIEDDPYAALRFSGEKLPTIKSFDTSDNVIVLTSFQKRFPPVCALRSASAARISSAK